MRTFPLVFAILLTGASAAAPDTPPPAVAPSNDVLDGLLAAHRWNDLGAALAPRGDAQGFIRSLGWLAAKLKSGQGGFYLGMIYARDLWVLAEAKNDPDAMQDMRITASAVSLYDYEIIAIDGQECADGSSVNARLEQLLKIRSATFAFLRAEPASVKDYVVRTALAMDKQLGPLRPRGDEMLCNFGMEMYMAAMKAGNGAPVPNTDGHFGRTIAVTTPPGWAPMMRAPKVYEPAMAEQRSRMPDLLAALAR